MDETMKKRSEGEGERGWEEGERNRERQFVTLVDVMMMGNNILAQDVRPRQWPQHLMTLIGRTVFKKKERRKTLIPSGASLLWSTENRK